MNMWSLTDWLMIRFVLAVAFVTVVIAAAYVATAIRKRWTALRVRRAPGAMVAAPVTLPNASAMPETRRPGEPLPREAANDSRPRAA